MFTEGRLETWNAPKYNCLKRWFSNKVHQWATILRFLPTLWYLHSLLCSFEDLLSQLHQQQWSPLCYASVVRLTLSLSLPTAHYIHSLQAHRREREIIFMLFPWSTSLSLLASLFSLKSIGISEHHSHSESLVAHGPLHSITSSPPSAEKGRSPSTWPKTSLQPTAEKKGSFSGFSVVQHLCKTLSSRGL